jgi:hypothetical protein
MNAAGLQKLLDEATKGPWQSLTEYYSDGVLVLDPNGFQHVEIRGIAILHEYDKIAPHWGMDDRCHYDIALDTQKANARLIALAPALARRLIAAEKLAEALRLSGRAVDDWLHIYASDLCDEGYVEESKARVNEKGTLAYIADVQAVSRAALAEWDATP